MRKENHKQTLFWRSIQILTLLVMLVSIFSVNSLAQNSNNSSQNTTVEEGEMINGPGFFSGNIVQIDGIVEGTTFASGQEVHINGRIDGSLFAAAQTIYIHGEVTGNVYAAGQTVNIASQNNEDVFLAGQTIRVESDSEIGRDLFTAGSTILQEGTVLRHVFAGAQNFTLNGSVGGDGRMDIEQLTLQDSAVIEGDLSYESPSEAEIEENAVVGGETNWEMREMEAPQERSLTDRLVSIFLRLLWGILSALLVWFLIKLWKKDFWLEGILPIETSPLKTIGIGLLALIVTPILVLIALITIIGIPFALILAALYGIFLYLTKILLAVFIGSWLAKWLNLKNEVWMVLLGLILLEIIGFIPYVDFIVGLLVIITGLGALVLTIFNKRQSKDELYVS